MALSIRDRHADGCQKSEVGNLPDKIFIRYSKTMSEKNNQKWPNEQIDYILALVERLANKKIAGDIQARESLKALASSSTAAYWLFIVVLSCGAGAIVANAYLQNRHRDEQTLQEANQIKTDLVQKISVALTSLRELRDATTMGCKNTANQTERHRIAEERIKARYNLLRISRPMMYYLGEDFSAALSSFIAWEQSISDYCAPSAPTEAEWLTQQMGIEEKMNSAPAEVFAGY